MKRIVVPIVLASAWTISARAQEMTWLPRPSFRAGEVLRVDPRVKLQGQFRWFPSELAPRDGTFAMGMRRLGVEGTLFNHVDFEIERDFRDGGVWTDVYVWFRRFRAAQIQAGKFKVPFSLDELTGATNLDFPNRSMIGRDLAPGRAAGAVLSGRVVEKSAALSYEAGMFRHDGERARFLDNPGGGATFAGRVRAQPLRALKSQRAPRNLAVGLSTTLSDVPEGPGPNSLRARTIAGAPILPRVRVHGRRTRLGADASWEPGPFSVRGEVLQVWDERRRLGPAGSDLPRLSVGGWYVSSTWVVTGERKAGGVEARGPFLNGGFGALELAARYEHLRFGDDDPAESANAGPESAGPAALRSGATTLGLNWYLNRWSKIQFNGVRESFGGAARSPVTGRSSFWSAVCRLQFVV